MILRSPLDFSCAESISSVSIEIFSPLRMLIQELNCSSGPFLLLYTIEFRDHRAVVAEHDVDNYLVADFLEEGENMFMISICRENAVLSNTCDPFSTVETVNDSVTVRRNIGRLFPYGDMMRDSSFRGVLDGAVPLYPPDKIPFFSNYYSSLHVSNNI